MSKLPCVQVLAIALPKRRLIYKFSNVPACVLSSVAFGR